MPNPGINRDRIKPEYLRKLSQPLEGIYTAIAHDLMMLLAQAFNEGRQDTESFAWRSTMLAKLGWLRNSSYNLIASYSGDVSKAVRYAIGDAVRQGIAACEPDLAKALKDRTYVPSVDETTERVMNTYYDQAIYKCNMVNTVMLNSTLEYYQREVALTANQLEALKSRLAYDQQELNVQAGAVVSGAKSLNQAVRDAVVRMSDHGVTGFVDKAGRQWDADAYVDMDIRTTAANTAREAAFERNKDYGNNLIYVSAHVGARALCYPYQGKVYSIDGTSGECEDLNGNRISYEPLESTSYGEAAGLFGINCGHFNYPFIDGYTVIRRDDFGNPLGASASKADNEAKYALNQQQRAQERSIRALKQKADLLRAGGFPDESREVRAKATQRTAELVKWCVDNGQDYKSDRLRVTRTN